MNFSVSVIVPAYNAEKNLQVCLDHIFQSIDEDDSIIVVNDASTDSTEEIIKNNKCQHLNLFENYGPGRARNEGAKISEKDLIIFVDSDILITRKNIEDIKKYFSAHPHVHTITTSLNSDNQGQGFYTIFKNLYMEFITFHKEVSVNYVYGSFCAIRKKSFIPWPESLRYTEDSLWGYKQKKMGMTIHSLSHVKPLHLKEYNFFSLVKNDFIISYYFARSFFENRRWGTLYSKEKFGHTAKSQKASVILSVLIPLLSLLSLSAGFFFFLIWFVLNLKFFTFIFKKRGFTFSLKSIAWYYFDCIIYFAGIMHGFASCVGLKPKSKLREVT